MKGNLPLDERTTPCLHQSRTHDKPLGITLGAYLNGVELDFSRSGKPTDNAIVEAFNTRLRAECLNENWFPSLADAQEKVI